MAEAKIPPSERIVSSFKQLAVETNECNAADAELGETISILESTLAKLRPQVSAWYNIAQSEPDENGEYWTRDIGYARIGDQWNIALRRTWGNEYHEYHREEVWPFKDAPRWMHIESAGKLPDLFDELVKRTKETTSKLRARTAQAKELAAALTATLPETIPAPTGKAKGDGKR
jgi:hypothetical protein